MCIRDSPCNVTAEKPALLIDTFELKNLDMAAALTPPPRPPTDPVPQLRRAMLLRGGAACAGLDDGTCLVLTPDGRGLTVVAAADDGNEAVARHATRYCLSRYRPACAKLLGLRNALGDHAPFVAKRLMEKAAPHARRAASVGREACTFLLCSSCGSWPGARNSIVGAAQNACRRARGDGCLCRYFPLHGWGGA